MPRIKYSTIPGGLNVNNIGTMAPEGTTFRARNLMSLAGTSTARSTPPLRLLASGSPAVGLARSRTKFNGRFVNRGTASGPVERIERETASGSNSYTTLTLPADTHPTLRLGQNSNPMQFLLGQPTPERDEFLFGLDPGNSVSGGATDNALIKIKDDNTVTHWGILPPTATEVKDTTGIAATKVAQEARYIFPAGTQDAFDDASAAGTQFFGDGTGTPLTDWTLTSGDEDNLTAVSFIQSINTPIAPGSTKALKVRPEKDAVVQVTRIFGSPVDLTHFPISGNVSSEMDYIQFFIRVRRPTHIESVEIQFDTDGAGVGDFKRQVFSREINFTLVKGKQKKKLVGTGDIVPYLQGDYLKNFPPNTNDQSAADQMGKQTIPIAKNAWSKVSLPKNTFNGFTEGADWSTVKAIRMVVHTNTEGKAALFFDELQLVGGAGLVGDYYYTITYSSDDGTPSSAGSRSNPTIDDDDGSATGKRNSIVGPRVFDVDRQSVLLTFANGLAFDPQVKRVEIWRTVGNGAAYFLAGYITVTTPGTIAAATTFTDSCADYYGLNSTSTKKVVGNNTSFAVLDPTVELPIDNTSPNDPSFAFQDLADRTAYGRCWWARNTSAIPANNSLVTPVPVPSLGNLGLVYYSPPGRLEAVQNYVYVTAGITDPVIKVIVWNDRPYALSTSGLYEIIGTDEPFVAQKIEGAPGTRFQFSVQATAAGLIYLSDDGVYLFNGQYAKNITDPVLLPVFRHRQSVGELVVATPTLSVRSMAGKNTYYLGFGFTNFTMAYDFEPSTWRYLDGGQAVGNNAGAMFYDPSTGQAFVNVTGTDIEELEPQTYAASGTNTATIEPLPHFRAGPGKQGILRKVWFDLTKGTATGSSGAGAFAPTVVIDGIPTALTTFSIAGGGADDIHNVQEYNLNFPGEVFAVRLQMNGIRDIRINAIEMDIYVPGETDDAPS